MITTDMMLIILTINMSNKLKLSTLFIIVIQQMTMFYMNYDNTLQGQEWIHI